MKTIGRSGSSSEYTVFSSGNSFIHQGVSYERDIFNGRCYRMKEPGGVHSRLEREGGMARRRISTALFARLFSECEAWISEATKGGAA